MKVLISVIRRTEYATIIDMAEDDFNKYNEMLDGPRNERMKAEEQLNKFIDVRDWQNDELDSFENLQKIDE